jgi:hypothetical protein
MMQHNKSKRWFERYAISSRFFADDKAVLSGEVTQHKE